MVDLAIGVAHNALFIDLPLAIFFSGALVVVLLTFGERYLTLNEVALPIQFHGDTGVAFLVNGAKSLASSLLCRSSFFSARGVGDDMGARCIEWRDLAAK